jgi:hypothetical protein
LFQGQRPNIDSVPGRIGYGESFAVRTADAATTGSVSLIRPGSVTHNFDQNQRFLSLPFVINAESLVVTAPANSNLAPSGDYMLFVVNKAGVPSHAAFVRLSAEGGSGNNAPIVEITSPASNTTFTTADTVSFAGTANDMEEGDLTSSIAWNSSLDGNLGSGGSIVVGSLSVGTHTITASTTDLGGAGAIGSASIIVSVTASTPPPPPPPPPSQPPPPQKSSGGGNLSLAAILFLFAWSLLRGQQSITRKHSVQ